MRILARSGKKRGKKPSTRSGRPRRGVVAEPTLSPSQQSALGKDAGGGKKGRSWSWGGGENKARGDQSRLGHRGALCSRVEGRRTASTLNGKKNAKGSIPHLGV